MKWKSSQNQMVVQMVMKPSYITNLNQLRKDASVKMEPFKKKLVVQKKLIVVVLEVKLRQLMLVHSLLLNSMPTNIWELLQITSWFVLKELKIITSLKKLVIYQRDLIVEKISNVDYIVFLKMKTVLLHQFKPVLLYLLL